MLRNLALSNIVFFIVLEILNSSKFYLPNAPSIRPVTSHTRASQQWAYRFIKQKMVSDKLVLFRLGHVGQGVVFAFEFTVQSVQGVDGDFLDFAAFFAGAVRG